MLPRKLKVGHDLKLGLKKVKMLSEKCLSKYIDPLVMSRDELDL